MSEKVKKSKGWVFGGEEPEWLVWLLVAVLLICGIGLKAGVTGQTESYKEGGISVSYPAGWLREEAKGEGEKLVVKEPFSSGQYPVRVEVWERKVEEVSKKGGTLSEIALAMSSKRKNELQAYRVLGMRKEVVGGAEGVVTEYAYVAPEETGGSGSLPVVAQAEELLVVKGDKLVQVRYAAKSEVYEERAAERESVIKSVRVE